MKDFNESPSKTSKKYKFTWIFSIQDDCLFQFIPSVERCCIKISVNLSNSSNFGMNQWYSFSNDDFFVCFTYGVLTHYLSVVFLNCDTHSFALSSSSDAFSSNRKKIQRLFLSAGWWRSKSKMCKKKKAMKKKYSINKIANAFPSIWIKIIWMKAESILAELWSYAWQSTTHTKKNETHRKTVKVKTKDWSFDCSCTARRFTNQDPKQNMLLISIGTAAGDRLLSFDVSWLNWNY